MKKIELLIPKDLHSIPLYQYQQFLMEFEGKSDNDYTSEEASLKMLEIFCGLKPKEGLQYKMTDVDKAVNKLNKVLNQKPSLITRFKLGGLEFGFVPDLQDLSFGEYIDAETNLTNWSTMNKAMAVLYRPIDMTYKGKYKLKPYDGVHYAEVLKNMPTSVAVSALVFFYSLETELLEVTLTSTMRQEKLQKKKVSEQMKILD